MQLERWLFRTNLASTVPIRRDPALVRVAGKLLTLRASHGEIAKPGGLR